MKNIKLGAITLRGKHFCLKPEDSPKTARGIINIIPKHWGTFLLVNVNIAGTPRCG